MIVIAAERVSTMALPGDACLPIDSERGKFKLAEETAPSKGPGPGDP
jgi:hypothetical protein